MEADNPFANYEPNILGIGTLKRLGAGILDVLVNRHSTPPEAHTGASAMLDEALEAQPIPEDLWG